MSCRGRRRGTSRPTGTAGTGPVVLDAGDLEVLVDFDGHVGAVALGHVRLVGRAFGVGLDPLDGAARYGGLGGGPHLVGGVTRQQLLLGAVLPDVPALCGIELASGSTAVGRGNSGARAIRRLG